MVLGSAMASVIADAHAPPLTAEGRCSSVSVLRTLRFRSNNTMHQPIIADIALVLRHAEAGCRDPLSPIRRSPSMHIRSVSLNV